MRSSEDGQTPFRCKSELISAHLSWLPQLFGHSNRKLFVIRRYSRGIFIKTKWPYTGDAKVTSWSDLVWVSMLATGSSSTRIWCGPGDCQKYSSSVIDTVTGEVTPCILTLRINSGTCFSMAFLCGPPFAQISSRTAYCPTPSLPGKSYLTE